MSKRVSPWLIIIIPIVMILIAYFIIGINSGVINLEKYFKKNKLETIKKESKSMTEDEKISDYLNSTVGYYTKSINIEKNENGLYDIYIVYNRSTVYLHICGQDAQTYAKDLIKTGNQLNKKINKITVACSENDEPKYNVDINNFYEVTEKNIDIYTVLMDENRKNLNINVSQSIKQAEEQDKKNYKLYDYKTIFRYSDDYVGKLAKFRGQVIQVIENSSTETYSSYSYRVNVTKDSWGFYEDTIYVTYFSTDKTEPRILEDDIITVYGKLTDLYTYETIMGASVTIPAMDADYLDLN